MNWRIEEIQLLVLGAGLGAAALAFALSKTPRFAANRRILHPLGGTCAFASFLSYKLGDLVLKWETGDSYTMSLVWGGIILSSMLLKSCARDLWRNWTASEPKLRRKEQ